MRIMLTMHILAGGLGLMSGFVALYAAKGARLHRSSGMVFVYAMAVMAVSGAAIAAVQGAEASVIGGTLAAYLVITAVTTVRPPFAGSRWLNLGAMLAALAIGLASLTLGLDALARGGMREGIPAPVLFMFSAVALLASASDIRLMRRSGGVHGAPRLTRHLWRMCFALYIAAASFFLGQADEFPEPLRIFPLLAIPVLAPLLAIPYWLRRFRVRRGVWPTPATLTRINQVT